MSPGSWWQRLRSDLVDRRLLPIPVVLLAGVIAVPLLATRDRSTADALPFLEQTTTTAAPAKKAAPKTSPAWPSRHGEVDPFATAAASGSAATPAAGDTSAPQAQSSAPTSPTAEPQDGDGSGSNGSGAAATSTPAAQPVANSTVIQGSSNDFVIRAVDLRMGGDIVPRIRRDVPRLAPLPSNDAPAALFLGVLPGAKSAAFRLSPGVTVAGDGTCVPRRAICAQLVLRKGQRALLTRPSGRRLRLELVRVRVTRTADEARARRAYDRYSPAGQCILDTVSAYTFDNTTGLLHRAGAVESCRYADADGSGSLRGAKTERKRKVKKSGARAD